MTDNPYSTLVAQEVGAPANDNPYEAIVREEVHRPAPQPSSKPDEAARDLKLEERGFDRPVTADERRVAEEIDRERRLDAVKRFGPKYFSAVHRDRLLADASLPFAEALIADEFRGDRTQAARRLQGELRFRDMMRRAPMLQRWRMLGVYEEAARGGHFDLAQPGASVVEKLPPTRENKPILRALQRELKDIESTLLQLGDVGPFGVAPTNRPDVAPEEVERLRLRQSQIRQQLAIAGAETDGPGAMLAYLYEGADEFLGIGARNVASIPFARDIDAMRQRVGNFEAAIRFGEETTDAHLLVDLGQFLQRRGLMEASLDLEAPQARIANMVRNAAADLDEDEWDAFEAHIMSRAEQNDAYSRAFAKAASDMERALNEPLFMPGSPLDLTTMAGRSIIENIPSIGATVAGAAAGSPVTGAAVGSALLSASSGARAFNQARDQGFSFDTARTRGLGYAGAESIPEFAANLFYVGRGINFLGRLSMAPLVEGATEAVTGAAQIGIDEALDIRDLTPAEAREEIAEQALVGAIAGPVQAGAIGAGPALTEARARRKAEREARERVGALSESLAEEFGADAEASEARKSSPEAYEQIMQARRAGTPTETMHVDPEEATKLFQTQEEAETYFEKKLRVKRGAFREARERGARVPVRTSTWEAHAAGTPEGDGLKQHFSFEADGETAAEAKARREVEGEVRAQRVEEEARAIVAGEASPFEADEVKLYEEVRDELAEAGRPQDAAEREAAVAVALFRVVAKDWQGMTPRKLRDQFLAHIRGTGELAREAQGPTPTDDRATAGDVRRDNARRQKQAEQEAEQELLARARRQADGDLEHFPEARRLGDVVEARAERIRQEHGAAAADAYLARAEEVFAERRAAAPAPRELPPLVNETGGSVDLARIYGTNRQLEAFERALADVPPQRLEEAAALAAERLGAEGATPAEVLFNAAAELSREQAAESQRAIREQLRSRQFLKNVVQAFTPQTPGEHAQADYQAAYLELLEEARANALESSQLEPIEGDPTIDGVEFMPLGDAKRQRMEASLGDAYVLVGPGKIAISALDQEQLNRPATDPELAAQDVILKGRRAPAIVLGANGRVVEGLTAARALARSGATELIVHQTFDNPSRDRMREKGAVAKKVKARLRRLRRAGNTGLSAAQVNERARNAQAVADEVFRRQDREEGDAESVLPQMTDTKAANFLKWFKDSKAVDANGAPLVVFHGSGADITEFRARRGGGQFSSRGGFWFTSSAEVASEYAGQAYESSAPNPRRPVIYPVYLSVQNPFVVDLDGALYDEWVNPETGLDYFETSKWAKENGHDGVIFKNARDGVDVERSTPSDVYQIFKPTQAKSIFNKGEWNPRQKGLLDQGEARPDARSEAIRAAIDGRWTVSRNEDGSRLYWDLQGGGRVGVLRHGDGSTQLLDGDNVVVSRLMPPEEVLKAIEEGVTTVQAATPKVAMVLAQYGFRVVESGDTFVMEWAGDEGRRTSATLGFIAEGPEIFGVAASAYRKAAEDFYRFDTQPNRDSAAEFGDGRPDSGSIPSSDGDPGAAQLRDAGGADGQAAASAVSGAASVAEFVNVARVMLEADRMALARSTSELPHLVRADKTALDVLAHQAERMRLAGTPVEKIEARLAKGGALMRYDPTDGVWEHLLDSSRMKLSPGVYERVVKDGRVEGRMGDLLSYPELFSIRDYDLIRFVEVKLGVGARRGQIDESGVQAFGKTEEEILNTLAHEIQHAADHIDGRYAGSSPDIARTQIARAREDQIRTLQSVLTSEKGKAFRRWLAGDGRPMVSIQDAITAVATDIAYEHVETRIGLRDRRNVRGARFRDGWLDDMDDAAEWLALQEQLDQMPQLQATSYQAEALLRDAAERSASNDEAKAERLGVHAAYQLDPGEKRARFVQSMRREFDAIARRPAAKALGLDIIAQKLREFNTLPRQTFDDAHTDFDRAPLATIARQIEGGWIALGEIAEAQTVGDVARGINGLIESLRGATMEAREARALVQASGLIQDEGQRTFLGTRVAGLGPKVQRLETDLTNELVARLGDDRKISDLSPDERDAILGPELSDALKQMRGMLRQLVPFLDALADLEKRPAGHARAPWIAKAEQNRAAAGGATLNQPGAAPIVPRAISRDVADMFGPDFALAGGEELSPSMLWTTLRAMHLLAADPALRAQGLVAAHRRAATEHRYVPETDFLEFAEEVTAGAYPSERVRNAPRTHSSLSGYALQSPEMVEFLLALESEHGAAKLMQVGVDLGYLFPPVMLHRDRNLALEEAIEHQAAGAHARVDSLHPGNADYGGGRQSVLAAKTDAEAREIEAQNRAETDRILNSAEYQERMDRYAEAAAELEERGAIVAFEDAKARHAAGKPRDWSRRTPAAEEAPTTSDAEAAIAAEFREWVDARQTEGLTPREMVARPEWGEFMRRAKEAELQTEATLNQGETGRRGFTDLRFNEDGTTRSAGITFTGSRNPSTFFHEFLGHITFEMYRWASRQPDAPAWIKDDYAKILAFLGVQDDSIFNHLSEASVRDDDSRLTHELAKSVHERWARAAELYLMEGRAPAEWLRPVLSRIANILKLVYAKTRHLVFGEEALQANDVDIREVFDRMLATDEEIAAAEERAGRSADFETWEDAQDAGLTRAEWNVYQRARDDAQATMQERARAIAMASIRREREAAYKAALNDPQTRLQAREIVEQEPVYRALIGLTQRGGRRLDRARVEEIAGEDVIERLPKHENRQMHAKRGGVDPDIAAGAFGFENGAALIEALASAPPLKEAIDARVRDMVQEFSPDYFDDAEKLEAAIDEIVHADQAMRVAEIEAKIAADKAGVYGINRQNARVIAQAMMAEMTLDQALRVQGFLADERRAAKRASDVAAKITAEARKDGSPRLDALWLELLQHKQQQMLAQALYREAREVEKLHNRTLARAKRFARQLADARSQDDARKRRLTISIDYLVQIENILDRYGLRKRISATQLAKEEAERLGYMAWRAQMEADGRGDELGDVPPRFEQPGPRIAYKTLTVDEFRAVNESIDNLRHLGRLKHDLKREKAKRDLERTIDTLEEGVQKRARGGRKHIGSKTAGERMRRSLASIFMHIMEAETIVEGQIDGGVPLGPGWAAVIEPVEDGLKARTQRLEESAERWNEINSAFSERQWKAMNRKRPVAGAPGVSMSHADRLAVGLNWGNEGNRKALAESPTFASDPRLLEAVIASLTAQDWAYIQSVWDYIGEFREEVGALEKRMTGIEPEWVQPDPFETADGSVMRGGYYPLKYDDGDVYGTVEPEPGTEGTLRDFTSLGSRGRADTRRSHTKKRVGSNNRDVMLDMNLMYMHVNTVIHDLALREPVSQVSRVLRNRRFRTIMGDAGREAGRVELDKWIRDVADGEVAAADAMSRIMRGLRGHFTFKSLAYSATTAAIQPTGLLQSWAKIGLLRSDLLAGILRGAQAMVDGRILRQIRAESEVMRQRAIAMNKEVADAQKILRGGSMVVETSFGSFALPRSIFHALLSPGNLAGRQRGDRAAQAIIDNGYWLMNRVQQIVDIPTYLAAKRLGMRVHGFDEAKAIKFAEKLIQESQGATLFSRRSGFERGSVGSEATGVRQSEWVKNFSVLMSYMALKPRIMYLKALELRAAQGVGGKAIASADFMATALVIFSIEAALTLMIREALRGDYWPDEIDDSEKKRHEAMLGVTLMPVMASMPGLNFIATDRSGFQSGPALTISADEIAKFWSQADQGEVDTPLLKAGVTTASLLTPLPAAQINRTMDAGFHALEGHDVAWNEFIFGLDKD